jgi:alkylhydroperoxidase family enzyme
MAAFLACCVVENSEHQGFNMSETTANRVEPLDAAQWPPVLDGVCTDMNGAPINVQKLMAHSPNLLRAWWDFRNYSVSGGSLGKRLGELVILRVGVHLGAWYEWGSHVDRAQRIGMSADAIFQTLNLHPNLDPSEVLILTAVDELMMAHKINAATRAALEKYYDTAQLMDLIAIQGMYVILGGFINTWDLALDGAVAARIETVTNRADFERSSAAFQSAIKAS